MTTPDVFKQHLYAYFSKESGTVEPRAGAKMSKEGCTIGS